MFPLAFALIRDEFPRDKVPTATGIIGAMFAVGATIGFIGGGYITQTYSWQIVSFKALSSVRGC
jgi:MFS family permease